MIYSRDFKVILKRKMVNLVRERIHIWDKGNIEDLFDMAWERSLKEHGTLAQRIGLRRK